MMLLLRRRRSYITIIVAGGWNYKAQIKSSGETRHLTTHSTGARVSLAFIVNLAVPTLNARPVNSSVRRLKLNIILQSYEIYRVAAASRLVACGY